MTEMKRPALPLTGGCPCEAVRFEVSAMPLLVYACHCTECQRWSGSAFSMSMPVASKSFRVVRGEPKPWRRIGASGVQSAYWFCGDCGGRVYGERDARPDIRSGPRRNARRHLLAAAGRSRLHAQRPAVGATRR